jgi:alpha-glucosidase
VYLDDFGNGLLFSDEGDGYGDWRLDEFSFFYENEKLTIMHQYIGDFKFPYQQIEIYIHGMNCHHAWIDQRECSIEGNKVQLKQLFQTLIVEGTLIK